MTTNKQLQDWLKQFPDNVEIKVVSAEEVTRGYSSYANNYTVDMELPTIEMEDLTWASDFENVQFDVIYDYDEGKCVGLRSITLGKNHNE